MQRTHRIIPAAVLRPIGIVFTLSLLMLCAFSPPTGRPPVGPLQRYEPRVYDVKFGALLKAALARQAERSERIDIQGTPIYMPIMYLGTYNRVSPESVRFTLWLDSRETFPALNIISDLPLNTVVASATVEEFRGDSLRWQVQFLTQVWSSRIDETRAMEIPWPNEWPEELQDALQPQMYIESSEAVILQAVASATQNNVRSLPPYLAAKSLVRHCINFVQTTGDGEDRGEFSVLRGMVVNGAMNVAQQKRGSAHDLVCMCVATLRAAGIPARPVIGIEEEDRGRKTLVSWAEFYLPDAGWIPFDPYVMRGKGIRTMDLRKPWPEFGSMKDLNRRIPLSHHFLPPISSQAPGSPAVWGWDPRPGRPNLTTYQVLMEVISRGRGADDPA